MSKPIIKAEINENIPTIGVNVPDANVPVLPVETIGSNPVLETLSVTENGEYRPEEGVDGFDLVEVNVSDVPPVLETLSVTENGEYRPEEGVDGFNVVTVNVPPSLPAEYLESEFDLLHSDTTNGFLDSVKNHKLKTSSYRDFGSGYINGRDTYVQMNIANEGDIKKVIVKTGEFDRSVEPNEEWLNIMRLNDTDWHFNLCYNNDNDYWRVSDESGATVDIPASILPKYSFENTTFEIVFGAKYINGILYRGIKQNNVITEDYSERMFVYLNNNLVMTTDRNISPIFRVGGGNGWIGAKIENVKIYDVLNCYDRYYEEVQ